MSVKGDDNRRKGSSGDRRQPGLGQVLVEEALRRGAKRVYAGTRQPLVHPTSASRR
jgi:hypothetical protein